MFIFKKKIPSMRRRSTKKVKEKRETAPAKRLKHSSTVSDYKTERDLCEALVVDDLETHWCCDNLDTCSSEEECLLVELKRLKALRSYNVLDSAPERRFEQFTGMACKEFDVPIALVSLVDLGRQWFKSNRGLGDARQTERSAAFCAHAILSKLDMLIVPDATKDGRFMNNRLVTGPPFIRFYAGAPLITPEGYKLGTLCIISGKIRPQGLSKNEQTRMKELAAMVVQTLVQRRLSTQLQNTIISPIEDEAAEDPLNDTTQQLQFGDLFFTFTDKFELRWQVNGTDKNIAGSFYHPIVPKGFFPLSTICVPHSVEINGIEACLCVKPAVEGAVKHPVTYTLIWEEEDFGPSSGGSCWRPVPPAGYVSLGDIFVKGRCAPSLQDCTCVRKDLTIPGLIGTKIWSLGTDAGAKSNISIFESLPTLETSDQKKAIIGVQAFLANSDKYDLNEEDCNSLLLPFPVTSKKKDTLELVLNSEIQRPTEYSDDILFYRIPIPCTAVSDKRQNISRKVKNSPFYFLDISFKYHLELFKSNEQNFLKVDGDMFTVGIDDETCNTFTALTGVCLSLANVINISTNTGQFSYAVELDLDALGFDFEEALNRKEIQYKVEMGPKKTHALWSLVCIISLKNMRNAVVGKSLEFSLNRFKEDYYPKDDFCVTID